MQSFNYLRGSREPWEQVAQWFVPRPLRLPLHVFAVCLVFGTITWAFESLRLNQAQHARELAASAYAAQSRVMRDAAAYALRVGMLIELDRTVRRAAGSGTVVARRLASISRDLPPDAWLTAITPDASGISLEGVGANLDTVRRTLLAFGRDSDAGVPSLGRTDLDESLTSRPVVRFSMRLSAGMP